MTARVVLAVCVLAVLLTGCEDRECVRGHNQVTMIGKQTQVLWVCDEYAPSGGES